MILTAHTERSREVLADAIKRTGPRTAPGLSVLTPEEAAEFFRLPRNAIDALQLRCIQRDLKPRDLIPFLGSRARVSECMSGKREMSKSQIRAAHVGLGIPLEHLLEIEATPEQSDV